MDMSINQKQFVAEAMVGRHKVDFSYSGKYMFGRTCPAVYVDNVHQLRFGSVVCVDNLISALASLFTQCSSVCNVRHNLYRKNKRDGPSARFLYHERHHKQYRPSGVQPETLQRETWQTFWRVPAHLRMLHASC